MSSEKKDLTRIEDLGEYLHELSQDDESFEPPADLPTENETSDFGSSESFESEEPAFGTTEESTTDFSTPTEESSDFGTTEETPDFGATDDFSSSSEETTEFGSSDFNTSDFGTTEEAPYEANSKEDPFETSSFETPSESVSEPEPGPFEPIVSDPEPEPVVQTQSFSEEKTYKTPETFEDLKKFAESSSFAGMGAEGNPSFSVLLKNVRYIEDVNDIMSMLKELGLMSDSEEQTKARLMRGNLLVPRISEFAAIFLAHKLRRFDIDIQVGLSDEIHPPKHQESPETGLVSKHTLYQNQTHHFHFDDPKLELSHIIVASSSNLEGHQVIRYLGVASEHKMLDSHIVEDEGSEDIPRHYSELAQKLKAHALKAHANAVIGLNYQLTPLPSEYGLNSSKYRLSCTGNLVWVNKL
jgi:hypothetical protein